MSDCVMLSTMLTLLGGALEWWAACVEFTRT
jgi:hypothetical protein